MEQRVGDVTAVLDALGIRSAHFFGFSYGGRIGFELAKLVPHRIRSLIIGGAGAKGINPTDSDNFFLQIFEAGQDGLERLVTIGEQSISMSAEMKRRFLANDSKALLAIVKSPPWVNLEDDLPGMTIPALIFAGESDPAFLGAKEAGRLLNNATFVPLPGRDHSQSFYSDLMLPHIKKFLGLVNQK